MLVNKLTALEAEDLRKLKRFAKQEKTTVNRLIRDAVKNFIRLSVR